MVVNLSRVPVKGPEAKLKGGCEGEGAIYRNLFIMYEYQVIGR